MINLTALQKALPACELQPNTVAWIEGFESQPRAQAWEDNIRLMEPPAGQHIPYVDPHDAMVLLFMYQGLTEADATFKAETELTKIREHLDPSQRVIFFDYFSWQSPEHIPMPTLISYLRQSKLVSDHLAKFLDHAVEVTLLTASFKGPDNHEIPWSLTTLPDVPSPKAMIEFVPGYEWDEDALPEFEEWRNSIRDVSDQLEQALGKSVYDFKVPDCETDDDNIHRFLFLHWICTYAPKSTYVQYLVARSQARDVEELKAALIHPDSYSHPFEMYDAFGGMSCGACRFEYLKPNVRKRIAIVFLTGAAQAIAEHLIIQKINYDVMIMAPEELTSDVWIKTWTRYAKTSEVRYLKDGVLNNPVEVLTQIDELIVVAGHKPATHECNLALTDSVEDLLWMAMKTGLITEYRDIDGYRLMLTDSDFAVQNAAQRVAERQKRRAAFTAQLGELRLWPDYCSSGLWDNKGRMISYDLIDLPFHLIRRISDWQKDYTDTLWPPAEADDKWWDEHEKDEVNIANELQASLGLSIPVKLYRHDQWVCVTDINHSEGDA